MGMYNVDIAQRTGLSYYTLLNWAPRGLRRKYKPRESKSGGGAITATGHFEQLAIKRRPNATVTVANQAAPEVVTVTVTIPGGIVVSGVAPAFLSAWLGHGAPK